MLLVEDDPIVSGLAGVELRRGGLQVDLASSAEETLEYLARRRPDAIVINRGLTDLGGFELLEVLLTREPELPVLVHTATPDLEFAIGCMRAGATDYVIRSEREGKLLSAVQRTIAARGGDACSESIDPTPRLLGLSSPMLRVRSMVTRAGQCDVTVMLIGESGTGKKVAARAIHDRSPRAGGPFVYLNCGSLPETAIERELLGVVGIAANGALKERVGFLERASGGTLFLDDIDALPADWQRRLAHVLQERAVTRVGESNARPVDLRILSATSRDLRAMTLDGEFRQDLYYHLAVFPIELPPLRLRSPDVLLLAERFLAEFMCQDPEGPRLSLSREAASSLTNYAWPGNVRELRNVLERARLMTTSGLIELEHLPKELLFGGVEGPPAALPQARRPAVESAEAPLSRLPANQLSASGPLYTGPLATRPPRADIRTLEEEERRIVHRALELTGWDLDETATRLGLSRAAIRAKLEAFGLGSYGC